MRHLQTNTPGSLYLRDSGSYPETAAQREVVHLVQLHSW
jgi:hypothetical protein